MLDARKFKKLSEEAYQGKDEFEGSVDLNVCRREGYVKALKDIKSKLDPMLKNMESVSHKGSRRYELSNGAMKSEQYSYLEIPELKSLLEHYLG